MSIRDISNTKMWLTQKYASWVSDYKRYLMLRGYQGHVNDWFFVKRGFIECWFEPGFHRFWQVWNPGIGYFTYKLYLSIGGNNRQGLGTITTFLINGLIHNIVVIPFLRRWDFPLPFTFLCFGLLTVGFNWLARHIDLKKLPWICHMFINVGAVLVSFEIGFRINRLLVHELLQGCAGT
jgi:hypothetical protein